MNYFIEKHDMEIILDALEALHEKMKRIENVGLVENVYPYSIDDVDTLFESLENSGEESWDLK